MRQRSYKLGVLHFVTVENDFGGISRFTVDEWLRLRSLPKDEADKEFVYKYGAKFSEIDRPDFLPEVNQ